MNMGFDTNDKFYIEYPSCTREVGTLREESDRRAREIFEKNPKVMLCLSSGLDSQIALHSFMSQGIPLECSFLRLDGFNDNEYENLKTLEKKYGVKVNVVNINPNHCKEELTEMTKTYDAHANHCLQRMFVSQLPKDHDVVQVLHDPWIVTKRDTAKHYLYHSYYDPEIARYRTLKSIDRSGNIVMFGDSSEYFLSSINDELFHYFLRSWIYYDGNGLLQYGNKLNDVLRYDYYIKPMLYAKHWKDELVYFPKFSGYENIDWLFKEVRTIKREKQCFVDYDVLLHHLKSMNGQVKRLNQV